MEACDREVEEDELEAVLEHGDAVAGRSRVTRWCLGLEVAEGTWRLGLSSRGAAMVGLGCSWRTAGAGRVAVAAFGEEAERGRWRSAYSDDATISW